MYLMEKQSCANALVECCDYGNEKALRGYASVLDSRAGCELGGPVSRTKTGRDLTALYTLRLFRTSRLPFHCEYVWMVDNHG